MSLRPALGATLALLVLLPLAAPVTGALAAFVGAGPSDRSSGSGNCAELTAIAIYPSVLSPGLHAAEIGCVFAWPFNTHSLGVGYSGMPSHVMHDLEGSAETGFAASGSANSHGTSPGTLDWAFTIGPLGSATEWSLDMVFYPDPDYLGTGPRPSWWRGTADFVGASG